MTISVGATVARPWWGVISLSRRDRYLLRRAGQRPYPRQWVLPACARRNVATGCRAIL
jgi:hypothetical protein